MTKPTEESFQEWIIGAISILSPRAGGPTPEEAARIIEDVEQTCGLEFEERATKAVESEFECSVKESEDFEDCDSVDRYALVTEYHRSRGENLETVKKVQGILEMRHALGNVAEAALKGADIEDLLK